MVVTITFILLALSFVAYHYTFFSYSSYIFNTNKFSIVACAVCGAINFVAWCFYIVYLGMDYEAYMLVFYVILLCIETKIVFKLRFVHMLFISVTFGINLFAKRIIFIGLLEILSRYSFVPTLSTMEITTIISILTFSASISTINLARKSIPRFSVDTILADSKNISFITAAFSLLFVTLFTFSLTVNVDIGSNDLLYHYMILGTFIIASFAAFIAFAHKLAELRISTETYKRLSRENSEYIQVLKELEKDAITDDLTGLFTRDYADTTIEKFVNERRSFFIAFIDLDGLKIVNDKYGHEEGDFYITTVANTIKSYFNRDIVCRYGGDEIVVIGDYRKEDDVTLALIHCYNSVTNIASTYKKSYQTSISYGVAFNHSYELISATELVSIADSRMYKLKKSKNKHRKVDTPYV